MFAEKLDIDNWVALPLKKNSESLVPEIDKSHSPRNSVSWKGFKSELSPLTLYLYLKSRFGDPNGIAMIGKQNSMNNIIHWHYTINSQKVQLNFLGHSSGLEIVISSTDYNISDDDRESFIALLKSEFSKHGRRMNEMKRQLDVWTLFINPFARLNQTVHNLMAELEYIDVTEVKQLPSLATNTETKSYTRRLESWLDGIHRAAALGTTLRMIFPVVLESFVNLVIYILRKRELREDTRLYEGQIRQHIDVRVKSLHLICDGFKAPVDGNDQRFKDFHTLMNGRNDFLHGNVDPIRLQLEDIFVDGQTTPLYKQDGGILKTMMPKYLADVSLAEVQKDERTVSEFVGMVMELLEDSTFETLYELVSERFPAINKNTNGIAVVVPDKYVEGLVSFSRHAADDPNYQLFLDDATTFEMYIPNSWQHNTQEDRHYFRPHEIYKAENLILSVGRDAYDPQRIDAVKNMSQEVILGNKSFYLFPTPPGLNSRGYIYISEDKERVAHFTYTYPEKQDPILDWRSLKQMITDAELILASFSFIEGPNKDQRVFFARYTAFIRGIASGRLLFVKAVENKAFFEAVTMIRIEIDALLRVAIVMHDQLQERTDLADVSWIYQAHDAGIVPFDKILNEAQTRFLIDENLVRQLLEMDAKYKLFSHTFIVSGTTLLTIEELAKKLDQISEKIGEKVAELEQKQVEEGVGIGKNIGLGTSALYRKLTRAKLGGASRV